MTGLPFWIDIVVRGLLLTAVVMAWILVFVRIVGLRSLSKMTAVDFISTIATGSLVAQAGASTSWGAFVQALCAIGAIFLVQWLVSLARRRSGRLRSIIGNSPLLLVEEGRILSGALDQSGMSRAELLAELRKANLSSLAAARAVILERTGDISVLSGEAPDPALLEDVRRPG